MGSCSTFLREEFHYKLFFIFLYVIVVCSCPFTYYLFIEYGLKDIYTLGYSQILCYFIAPIVLTLAKRKSFSWLLYPFDILTSLCFWVLSYFSVQQNPLICLHISFPNSKISHFSKEPKFLFLAPIYFYVQFIYNIYKHTPFLLF